MNYPQLSPIGVKKYIIDDSDNENVPNKTMETCHEQNYLLDQSFGRLELWFIFGLDVSVFLKHAADTVSRQGFLWSSPYLLKYT